MKLTLKESIALAEARDKQLKYSEKGPKETVDRVIVSLEKQRSAAMTRLAQRYHRLNLALKRMSEERDKVNAEMKEHVQALFDAEDVVYTRVVETNSFVLTLAKQGTATTKTTYDFEKIAEELAKLIPDELQSKVDEITEAYKKVTVTQPKSPALTVQTADEVEKKGRTVRANLKEGIADVFKKAATTVKALLKKVAAWGVSYDKKLAVLKKQAGL